MKRKLITTAILGAFALREASAEFGEIADLLSAAVRRHYGLSETTWVCLQATFPDRVIVRRDGKLYEFSYEIDDNNVVTLGKPRPVTVDYRELVLREATSELGQIMHLVMRAVRHARNDYAEVDSVFVDRVVVIAEGRYYSYPYTVDDSNVVTLGKPTEVLLDYTPVATGTVPVGAREAAAAGVFIEALAANASTASRYLVRVIRAGTSLNGVEYPAAVLREAVSLFDGVRVFSKSDDEHITGAPAGKDFRRLVGRLTEPRFVEAGGGEIQAVFDVLETSDVAAKLREAVERGMTDLFGLSIDAAGTGRKKGKFREATKLTKVSSVDLIIEPGAGGQVIRFAESVNPQESDMLRQQMLRYIEARDQKRAKALADASDEDVLQAYTEALAAAGGTGNGITAEDVDRRVRLVEARATARTTIAASNLPAPVQERLVQRFVEAADFTDADVITAITAERDFLVKLREAAGGTPITGLGTIHIGEDRADKVKTMLDDLFDRSKPATSFREAYIEITGDRQVTGLWQNCDRQRLREAAGATFREAVSSTTWGDMLGDSVARAVIRDYRQDETYKDWRWACDVVPVQDFRTQERTRMGGYGNLPVVAENGPYNALATPGDEKATYAVSKRGGTETVSLEAIANDDVGALRRIPFKLATAASRTLYEFVFDFFATNPTIYDTVALFHATHGNLGTAALSDASFAAARLAMKKQGELSSDKRLGITLSHLVIPSELEQTAYDMFVRGSNNDETFVQSRKPKVHVVDYWTDANNWFGTADGTQVPLIELGFYGGEEPTIFIQDSPTQGSLFTNDQIKYKIRHVYSGAVLDFRGFFGAIVPAP